MMNLLRNRSSVLAVAAMLAIGLAVPAFAANPDLVARINGVSSAATESRNLRIDTMDMAITVRGSIAETVLTLRFGNSGSQPLEGEFNFDMPLGSVVTGYALDINGTLVDGVLVPPHQAQVAYEQRVAARVDPGLVEVSHGARFSTRVFPILPGSGRTIRLKFTTPLDPETGYVLPLSSPGKIGSVKIRIENAGAGPKHVFSLPDGLTAVAGEQGYGADGKDVALGGTLTLRRGSWADPLLVSEHKSEGRFFEIADRAAPSGTKMDKPRKIAILWDASRSRLDARTKDEAALLSRMIDSIDPDAVEFISFNSGGVDRQAVKDASALGTAIAATRYAGATSFAMLDGLDLVGVDTCIIVSDGMATLDRRDGFAPPCRLYALVSGREADRGYLGSRARKSGGDLLDMESMSADQIMARMTRTGPQIVDVRDGAGRALDYALLDGGKNGWRIVGRAPDAGEIVVKLAGLGEGLTERRYRLPAFSAPMFEGAAELWAADMIGGSAADANPAELLALARRYSVASPLASFVVLETPNDYAQAGIAPPDSYPKAQRAQYDAQKAALDRQMADQRENRLGVVMAGQKERLAWWSAPKGGAGPRPPAEAADVAADAAANAARNASPAIEGLPPPPPPPPPPVVAPSPTGEESGPREIIVTGARRPELAQDSPVAVTAVSSEEVQSRRRPGRSQQTGAADAAAPADTAATPGDSGAIAIKPWSSDRIYITALEEAKDVDATFLAQEKNYGSLPAFYLDVAEWQFAKGDAKAAARTVQSALDLPTRNNDTLAIVAARLIRYGAVDRAIWLLEQLVAAETERPQPKRTLALALIDRAKGLKGDAARADIERALALLTEVILTPWDGRYPEIEQIALNEANALIPQLKALGSKASPLDPQLVKAMDVDVRIVVEWNTKNTDMDLWVDEPSGERVIYNNNRSRNGGRLSRDMTQGFGPEEYLIRHAMPGKYVVRINTFNTDRLNPNGPTTVTARLFRNYGRPNQSEQLIDLEVLPGKEGQRMIGTVEVVK